MALGMTVVSVMPQDATNIEEAVDMLRAYLGNYEDDRTIELLDELMNLSERITVALGL